MVEKDQFINREISWLSFNERVLQEAADPSVPLIERMRFLGIFSNNLDEFFKVRYASVRRVVQLGNPDRDRPFDGTMPDVLLDQIKEIVKSLQDQYNKIYLSLISELKEKNIHVITESEIKPFQEEFVCDYFSKTLNPEINVILLKKGRKNFPELRDSFLYLVVRIRKTEDAKSRNSFALIEVPTTRLPRFIELPGKGKTKYLMYMEDIIRFNLAKIFKIFRYDFIEAHALKISRDAELTIDNDLHRSFVDKIARSLEKRTLGDPVRMVFDNKISQITLDFLTKATGIQNNYDSIIPGSRYQNKRDLMYFPNLGSFKFEYKRIKAQPIIGLSNAESMLEAIAKRDFLMHTPYHSFFDFIRLLKEATIDPKVKSISMSIYRAADDSKVMATLINAARNGKKVSVNIELRARFDEAANLQWSDQLRKEGIEVILGVPGLKVHSKLCLIERDSTPKYISLIGTGNFNESTANIYTDFILFTADKRITKEVAKIFNFFKVNYLPYQYQHLIVSPLDSRKKINDLIDYEVDQAKAGNSAAIYLKLNNLVDKQLIKKLYEASQAGVNIQCIIRGVCSLVPGIKGLSDRIQILSIIDKFLEHSRMYWFSHSGKDLIYISSADLMTRSIDYRVEVASPIYCEQIKSEVKNIFNIYWSDNTKARIINSNLKNEYIQKKTSSNEVRAQFATLDYYKKIRMQ